MKNAACALCLIFSFALNTHASFRLPSGVYQIGELAEATEKSKSRGVPVTFLISDTDTTCGLCISATEEIIRELRARTVIVYARSKSQLPEDVRGLIQGVNFGKYIPYAMVVNADRNRLIGVIRYNEVKTDGRDSFRDLKKQILEDKSSS